MEPAGQRVLPPFAPAGFRPGRERRLAHPGHGAALATAFQPPAVTQSTCLLGAQVQTSEPGIAPRLLRPEVGPHPTQRRAPAWRPAGFRPHPRLKNARGAWGKIERAGTANERQHHLLVHPRLDEFQDFSAPHGVKVGVAAPSGGNRVSGAGIRVSATSGCSCGRRAGESVATKSPSVAARPHVAASNIPNMPTLPKTNFMVARTLANAPLRGGACQWEPTHTPTPAFTGDTSSASLSVQCGTPVEVQGGVALLPPVTRGGPAGNPGTPRNPRPSDRNLRALDPTRPARAALPG